MALRPRDERSTRGRLVSLHQGHHWLRSPWIAARSSSAVDFGDAHTGRHGSGSPSLDRGRDLCHTPLGKIAQRAIFRNFLFSETLRGGHAEGELESGVTRYGEGDRRRDARVLELLKDSVDGFTLSQCRAVLALHHLRAGEPPRAGRGWTGELDTGEGSPLSSNRDKPLCSEAFPLTCESHQSKDHSRRCRGFSLQSRGGEAVRAERSALRSSPGSNCDRRTAARTSEPAPVPLTTDRGRA